MADRPILFSSAMVRALLDGRKTQTRRILKPQPYPLEGRPGFWNASGVVGGRIVSGDAGLAALHRFAKGGRLYVRETFSGPADQATLSPREWLPSEPLWYWADGNPADGDWTKPKPGIHMPRWASRLTLTVTDVRVQRLQEISEADCVAEGAHLAAPRGWDHGQAFVHRDPEKPWQSMTPRAWYHELWDAINGAGSWDANPWVVAVTFTVERRNIDA